MRVLIVDDDEFAISIAEATLTRMGYTAIAARDGAEAMDVLRRGETRLVVTDWDMPGMNGIDLCRAIRREDLSGYVYVIMLTGREGSKQRLEGLCAGADDFLNKPLDPEELLVCLKTAERILALETRDVALFALAKLAESRDSETGAHVERVQSYARLLARNLSAEVRACHGVDDEYVRLLYQTTPLHDLGKVGIPDAILLKPGKLTPAEFAIMKTHTLIGAQTLDAALERFPNARFLQMARDIAATHHEKFDGSGYPRGLAGAQIPLCGRIVAVADVYDALTSRRVYKDAMGHEQAKAIILGDRGSHFDPEIVDAFVRAEQEIIVARERLRDTQAAGTNESSNVTLPAVRQRTVEGASTLLVVEDDPVIRTALAQLLAATGNEVIAVADGDEAMQVFDRCHPSVVLSDWVMPGMDGLELCRRIRDRDHATNPVHFIMLTAHSDKCRLLDAYRTGVDDFVSKPFDPEELLARVRAGIRAAKLLNELTRKASGSQALNAQLATMNSRLERLSSTDELTGLFNRRHGTLKLDEEWARAVRDGGLLSLAMVDADHFKNVNDTFGHEAGDVILRRLAAILREQAVGTDSVCRFGGEEFLAILPSRSMQEATEYAERCRAAVAAESFSIPGQTITATISIGVATRSRDVTEVQQLLANADRALYAAKHGGRNVVRVADQLKETSNMSDLNTQNPKVVDLAGVLQRCGGDPQFATAVVNRFREQAPAEVARLAASLSAGNADEVRRFSHNLKSMAAYLGADDASAMAKRIEDSGREGRLAEVAPILEELTAEIDRIVVCVGQGLAFPTSKCA